MRPMDRRGIIAFLGEMSQALGIPETIDGSRDFLEKGKSLALQSEGEGEEGILHPLKGQG